MIIVVCGDKIKLEDGTECRVEATRTANHWVTAVLLVFEHQGERLKVWSKVPFGSATTV